MNLAAVLDARAAADGRRIALVTATRSFTREGFGGLVAQAAARLRGEWCVRRGDRVAYLGLNRVEELALLFALARIGAIFVPLNVRLAVPELAAIVADAGPTWLVTDAGHHDAARAVLDSLPAHRIGLQPVAALDVEEDIAAPDDGAIDDLDPATPVLITYTSGTSGLPKGALHTQGGLLANADASIAAHAMTGDDRVLAALPLFHVGGLCIQTVPALLAGASVTLHPRFDATAWIDAIGTVRPTLALMVPTTLRAVIEHPGWAAADLSCLRVLMAGSSTIPSGLIDAVHARGVPLGQVYGSTETGPVTVVLGAAQARAKAGSAGWPCFAGSVRVRDAAGADLEPGAVGEIVIRAPNLMHGYWRMPALATIGDGWFATGDLGRFDRDGCLAVVGRIRDLIITGGENVYPAEVENVLLSIAGVVEAAVIGVPDDRWGEVPTAFVVKAAAGPQPDDATIHATLDRRLARFKHPRRVVFVDELPRNAMGKVVAGRLRERLAVG